MLRKDEPNGMEPAMELIVISDSKIKLMLTRDDMDRYRGMTKDVLREIMEDAKKQCGCTAMEGRIYVQMYPSKSGGCELFVTRLENRSGTCGAGEDRVLTDYRKYIFEERGSHIIYVFGSMNYLLGTCARLHSLGYSGSSMAYHDPCSGKYYLLLECETHIAVEYFGSLCPSRLFCYISEHCSLFCTGAVEKLAKFTI